MQKQGKIATVLALLVVGAILIVSTLAVPECRDGIDNDWDGKIDSSGANADPGCSSKNDATETSPTLICDNGLDESNDADSIGDFRISGGDAGCASLTDMDERNGACDNLQDDDADNTTDYPGDPGCTSYSDSSEVGTTQCDNNVESAADADALDDFPADPGCSSPADDDEVNGQCDDLQDNDLDNRTDYGTGQTADSKCASFTDADESPKDYCADTDGGLIRLIAGTVSGFDEDVPFSLSDFCLDATQLQEYYCGTKAQDYAPLSTVYNCAINGTTSCIAGACV